MSDDKICQEISALMDGECAPSTSRFLLQRYASCAQTRGRWTRFHVAREVLQGGHVRVDALMLSQRVAQALKDEAAPRRSRRVGDWLRPVAGVAVAASVAFVAVVMTRPVSEQPGPIRLQSAEAVNPATVERVQNAMPRPLPASATQIDPLQDERLREYLLRHQRVAPNPGRGGFTQYVYFVSPSASANVEETVEAVDETETRD